MAELENPYQYADMVERQNDVYALTKYQIILQWLRGKSSLHILNAGCGSGELSFLLAKDGHQVTGIDPGAEYIALANQQIAPELKTRCTFLVESIESYHTNQQFDVIVATDVLEHIKDDIAATQKLLSMLRPGGLLIITVPALPKLFGYHDEALGHFRRYTRRSLNQLMKRFPVLTVRRMRYFGFFLIPVCYLYSCHWRRSYPIASGKQSLVSSLISNVLRLILGFEKFVPLPLGTSLLALAVKKTIENR